MGKSTHQSRYSTPWDKTGGSTPLQSFLVEHYHARYDARHPPLASTGEAAVINSYLPEECPFCGLRVPESRLQAAIHANIRNHL